VWVSPINLEIALETIAGWIATGTKQYVCVTGVHGVMECQKDPGLRAIHNESGLTTPDGMPLVWAARYAGANRTERVYGPDLMLETCDESLNRGWSHFFYGGGPGVVEDLIARLVDRCPGLQIAGTFTPPYRELTEEETAEVVELINRSGADIVWVGLSTPKQERWMARFRRYLNAPVLVGVGAAFDIHAGRVAQAPPWMQRSGLEWFFRLVHEPRRLWRRYFRAIPAFVKGILLKPPVLVDKIEGDPSVTG
jgi:N-acetylglucosaminyldiphosphoundecaprenol N-acetyl-beta-D-mannosaminyltransferase